MYKITTPKAVKSLPLPTTLIIHPACRERQIAIQNSLSKRYSCPAVSVKKTLSCKEAWHFCPAPFYVLFCRTDYIFKRLYGIHSHPWTLFHLSNQLMTNKHCWRRSYGPKTFPRNIRIKWKSWEIGIDLRWTISKKRRLRAPGVPKSRCFGCFGLFWAYLSL